LSNLTVNNFETNTNMGKRPEIIVIRLFKSFLTSPIL